SRPDAVAVVAGDVSVTYGELDSRSDTLAAHLRARGARSEVRIGVCIDRSVLLVISLLGILKAGAVYVPIDASYPRERIDLMIADAEVFLMLTDHRSGARLGPLACSVIRVEDALQAHFAQCEMRAPVRSIGASSAYVMYTSGSTGLPKGVL